jgi:hypothetical protein
VKILYLSPRDDDDPSPEPARRRRLLREPPIEADELRELVLVGAAAGREILPEAA